MPYSKPLDRLKFLTCGSVDDGKSTLIGRLLYDCGQVPDDMIEAARRQSPANSTGPNGLDFAYLLDGLEVEREQGITIDVSYRSFLTDKRAYQVADCPGHDQYTRNMVTAASNSDVAILLVDARKGLLEQTRRHAKICAMLGIKDVALAINKMDLVRWSKKVFQAICSDFEVVAKQLNFATVTPIPTSAILGVNLASNKDAPPWYDGDSLLGWLEKIDPGHVDASSALRIPITLVTRPNQDMRAYLGTISSGVLKEQQEIKIGHSGQSARVKKILVAGSPSQQAHAGDAVAFELESQTDLTRGDVVCDKHAMSDFATEFVADVIWFDTMPMTPGRRFLLKGASGWVSGTVLRLKHRVDLQNDSERPASTLQMNEIGLCDFSTTKPFLCDPFKTHPKTGGFLIVDDVTNETIGAGLVRHSLRRSASITPVEAAINQSARAARFGHKPLVLWFTGLSGSGKSTIAKLTETTLWAQGIATAMLDGDNLRTGLCHNLGFSDSDRVENIRRAAEAAKLFTQSGLVVLCALISPSRRDREMARSIIGAEQFVEIFIDTPLEACIERDPKGLYARALKGEIPNFTGIGSPYEEPIKFDLRLETKRASAKDLADLAALHALAAIKL